MTVGSFSPGEAARIAFLVARHPGHASAELRQIFTIYLQTLETNPRHFASQRSARPAFVASLQEIAAHLGEPVTRELLEATLRRPVPDPGALLASLVVPPGNRDPLPAGAPVRLTGVLPEALGAALTRTARQLGYALEVVLPDPG